MNTLPRLGVQHFETALAVQPFVTPRSRMIFAGRMGESATAYQSPAKDLKYINSRIAAHSQQPIAAPAPAAETEPVSLCFACRRLRNITYTCAIWICIIHVDVDVDAKVGADILHTWCTLTVLRTQESGRSCPDST